MVEAAARAGLAPNVLSVPDLSVVELFLTDPPRVFSAAAARAALKRAAAAMRSACVIFTALECERPAASTTILVPRTLGSTVVFGPGPCFGTGTLRCALPRPAVTTRTAVTNNRRMHVLKDRLIMCSFLVRKSKERADDKCSTHCLAGGRGAILLNNSGADEVVRTSCPACFENSSGRIFCAQPCS